MTRQRFWLFTPVLFVLPAFASAADAPEVREFRTQKIGDVTYFHIRLETPRRMIESVDASRGRFFGFEQAEPDLSPRLVSPDGKATRIVPRRAANGPGGGIGFLEPQRDAPDDRPVQRRPIVPVEGLEFIGRLETPGEFKLTLLYPRESRLDRVLPGRRRSPESVRWEETTVSLDATKAISVALPEEAKDRRAGPAPKKIVQHPVRDDLEGLWAQSEVIELARLNEQVSDFGFYGFASHAAARKYSVPAIYTAERFRDEGRVGRGGRLLGSGEDLRDLYDTTTGAAAIAESLALRRMAGVVAPPDDKRTVDVAKIRGIDVEEHPWDKMMEGKKPADEPLAAMVPHDNWYLVFRSMRKLNELSDLMDQWGTGLQQAWEAKTRDHRLKERYEQQLCLRSTTLGRTLGPLVIKSFVATGSDAYLREGSDVTLIFHVNNKELFLAGVGKFLDEARKKFGDSLKESKAEHLGIAIEGFTTPLREVSCHRAVFDDFVVYSNSPAGLRRVLDAHKGKITRLSDQKDFQYMRTVFRADDASEDGFLYLSDAFIRQLVGPTSKIKEKRRIEALTSLYMITHGAMYTAWDTGKQPTAHRDVIAGANLKPQEVPMPEGKPAAWDASKQLALSDAYNTIHFATPLVELPIDKATQAEAQQYDRFRQEYLGLWRQYFDPIGLRFNLTGKEVKIDTYILPLVQNSRYNELRRFVGGGTVKLDASGPASSTMFQFLTHISPGVQLRESILGFGRAGDGGGLDFTTFLAWGLGPVGDWAMVRVDDSPVYAKLAELLEKADRGEDIDTLEIARNVFDLPIVLGVDIKNPVTFAAALAAARLSVLNALPGGVTWEPLEKPYKDVAIVAIRAKPETVRNLVGPVLRERPGAKPFEPALYYCMMDSGFYLSFSEKMLHDLIDQAESRKKDDLKTVSVNSSLYLSPGAAKLAGVLVRRHLENEIHREAVANLPLWHALYRCRLVPEKAEADKTADVAYQYLGFVPVSPDGAPYAFDARRDETSNERHGTLRRPTPQKDLAEGSPLARVWEQLANARADLRFREDGIHTTVTLKRQPAKKE